MGIIADLFYVDDTGFHAPDYPTILNALTSQIQTIIGADTYLDPDSQDGQQLAVYAQGIYDVGMVGLAVYNAFSPATGQGTGLSSNVKINGIRRQNPTNSTVDLVLIGQVGTTIINGQAQDILGQNWNLPASVTIPDSGTITVTATSVSAGAIAAATDTVTKVNTPTRGWQSVNNTLAATVGVAVEIDSTLRIRQSVSTELPSQSVLDGTLGAVANVAGVIDYAIYENKTSTTDGNGIPGHSISVVASGGDDVAIATAISLKKTPGTGTYGTTSEVVPDQAGVPNVISFYRPTVVPIHVVVNITALTDYTTLTATAIQAAVAAYIQALKIGKDVLYTKLYTPANLPGNPAGATFDITSILIERTGSPAAANVDIAFNEVAYCDTTLITVNVT